MSEVGCNSLESSACNKIKIKSTAPVEIHASSLIC